MQRRGGKKKFDNHDIEKQAAGTFAEKFPFLESMVIRIIYYQKGDNPILMTRTLHVYPEDFAYFHIPCLIHDCLEGSFEIAPIVMNILEKSKSRSEGRLACKGSLSKDLSPDHGCIEYTIEVAYKPGSVKPDVSEKKKEKVKTVEKNPKKEAPVKKDDIKASSVSKNAPVKPVKEILKSKQKTSSKNISKTPSKTPSKKSGAVGKPKKATATVKKQEKKKEKKKVIMPVVKATAKKISSKSKTSKASKPSAKKPVVKTIKSQKAKASTVVKKTSSKSVKKKKS